MCIVVVFLSIQKVCQTIIVLFQHKYCIEVPIHVYGAAVGEI
jgi:hypothetical protein